jgi:acyl-coenzyme A thioesterase PaaI-like protein
VPIGAAGARIPADSQVVHAGRRPATAEARLYAGDDGKLFAHAGTSCLILG